MHRRMVAALVVGLALLVLASAAPLVARAGGGCHVAGDGSTYTEGDATVIRMDTCSFAPTVVRVPEGTTIRFLNTATVQHQVVGRAQTWGTVLLDPGDERSVRFDDAGTFPYMCPLHPGMTGAIVVGSGEGGAAPPRRRRPRPRRPRHGIARRRWRTAIARSDARRPARTGRSCRARDRVARGSGATPHHGLNRLPRPT